MKYWEYTELSDGITLNVTGVIICHQSRSACLGSRYIITSLHYFVCCLWILHGTKKRWPTLTGEQTSAMDRLQIIFRPQHIKDISIVGLGNVPEYLPWKIVHTTATVIEGQL